MFLQRVLLFNGTLLPLMYFFLRGASSVKWTALAHPSPKLNKATSSSKPSGPF